VLIPNPGDIVSVSFRNKDIYSGEWELKGCPTKDANIDPKKYGLSDNQGNFILIDRTTNSINLRSQQDFNLNAIGKGNMTYEGDLDLTAPNVTINGNTTINGKLTVTDTCVFEGIAWKPHVHPYTWTDGPGAGDTSPPK
jgi:phage baseplate assembly protein gpV